MSMSERLLELRTHLGLSQRAFCKRAGIHQATYAPFEIGKREIRDIYITLICRVYDVSENWFRNGIGKMFVDKADRTLDELLSIYDTLSPLLKQFLLKQAKDLQRLQADIDIQADPDESDHCSDEPEETPEDTA